METIISYVKPELVVLGIVLYFVGFGIKKTELVNNKFIPLILGIVGIVLCAIYVFATSDFSGWQTILIAIFTSIVQGVLVAGLSTYADQMIKQLTKE